MRFARGNLLSAVFPEPGWHGSREMLRLCWHRAVSTSIGVRAWSLGITRTVISFGLAPPISNSCSRSCDGWQQRQSQHRRGGGSCCRQAALWGAPPMATPQALRGGASRRQLPPPPFAAAGATLQPVTCPDHLQDPSAAMRFCTDIVRETHSTDVDWLQIGSVPVMCSLNARVHSPQAPYWICLTSSSAHEECHLSLPQQSRCPTIGRHGAAAVTQTAVCSCTGSGTNVSGHATPGLVVSLAQAHVSKVCAGSVAASRQW